MFKKLFSATLLLFCGAAASFAAEIYSLDLNFYSTDGGTVKAVGSRMSGVTPADISVLLVYLERYRRTSHLPSSGETCRV